MKKIRLTEAELTNIIKRVINEQSDAKIPPVVRQKGSELARMAQEIIKKHMEYCKQIKSMESQIINCEFVTKRFKEQPLWVIADLDKSLNTIKSSPTQSLPVKDPFWEKK